MINWHPDVITDLGVQNYPVVIKMYENYIVEQPDNVEAILYLALAHLLADNLEEAQAIWLSVFFKATQQQFEQWQEILLNILDQESLRQLDLGQYQKSRTIREQILEINDDDINNLLHIVNLDIVLKTIDINSFNQFDIIDKVRNCPHGSLDFLLLKKVLQDILEYPYNLSILFAESVLLYSQNNTEIINIINRVGDKMSKEGDHTLYAIDLLEMCNRYPHNNLLILINLYTFYQITKNFDKLINIAEELEKRAETFLEKFNAQNLLLNAYLTLAEWEKTYKVSEDLNKSYSDINNHYDDLIKSPHRDTFFSGILNMLYLQDKPDINRFFINTISRAFQEVNSSFYRQVSHAKIAQKKLLKIGYIGHTFRVHSVGYLSRWLVSHHNRDQFKINLYVTQGQGDFITEQWFVPNVDKVFYAQRSMNQLIEEIYNDQIDILVDVDSLTLNLTALVMAAKPAPIQATWLGMDATGIPSIDYFIADPYVLPDNAQEYYSEKIWRLPQTYLGIDGFEVGVPTLRREDLGLTPNDIIYLNIQNAAKLNPDIIKLQLEIIKNVQFGYLVFKVRRDENRLKKYIYGLADNYHVSREKIRIIGLDPTNEIHRANLTIADVVLDTYPYNGATTTLEALWSEIPVLTKAGQQFAARNSYTFMVNAGITEGIAWTDEEYIEWGIKLGTDENLRKEISWKLRQSKKTSPLWNGKQFARDIEDAYRQMWEIYINNQNL